MKDVTKRNVNCSICSSDDKKEQTKFDYEYLPEDNVRGIETTACSNTTLSIMNDHCSKDEGIIMSGTNRNTEPFGDDMRRNNESATEEH